MSTFFEDNFLTPQTADFIPKLPPIKKCLADTDAFEVNYTTPSRQLLTDSELVAITTGSVFVFDSESFVNYSIIAFKHADSGKYLLFEYPFNSGKLKWVMQRFLTIGFNSKNYDMPIVTMAIAGFSTHDLKELSNKIIFGAYLPYQIEQTYKIPILSANHIDLIEVAPLQGSLKLYAGRLHCKRMQDIPIDPDAKLTSEQKIQIKNYCMNDVDNTELLFDFLKPQLELRYNLSDTYKVDLRSKSDAQIAEAVIEHELKRIGIKATRNMNSYQYFTYEVPSFLSFHAPVLEDVLNTIKDTVFKIDETGGVALPESISKLKITLGYCTYRIGIGGLHSSESTVTHKASEQCLLLDRDVSSYYPNIILNQELFPQHLGKPFLQVYKRLVQRRLTAKNTGQKTISDALKITINGTFGKLGNRYSILYSPQLLIQVTMSGQLCLLWLIDLIEDLGCGHVRVVSANTDGVLIQCDPAYRQVLNNIIAMWESNTHFVTEETEYNAVYARDVNNYIAIKTNGEVKVKGSYSERGSAGDSSLSRNPEAFICNDAVIEFLTKTVPLEETINTCTDIRRFVMVRNVKGGAIKCGKYLGKTVRWYYSTEMNGTIQYLKTGNTVPNSKCARPLMELKDGELVPDDLNYETYLAMAKSILVDIGAEKDKSNKQVLLDKFGLKF